MLARRATAMVPRAALLQSAIGRAVPHAARAATARSTTTALTADHQAIATSVRFTHNRNAPRASTGSPRPPSRGGSVLGNNRMGGGHGLFDVDEDDRVPTTRVGRAMAGARTSYRYLFGGALVCVMGGAAFMLGVYYFYNPEAEVRARTRALLQSNPQALRYIGPQVIDVTLRTLGSRSMQAHHRYPYVGSHPVEMQMVFQGKAGRAFVLVQYIVDGSTWKPVYLHMDTNHGRILLMDVRARQ